jgi:hypothetical protein
MAQFSKGDSSGYRWTWYTIQDTNNWQALKTDSLSITDTFYYRYLSDSALPTNFALVLTDGCSRIKDTAYTTVILTKKPMRGALSTIDTLICYQSAQTLIANFTGGDSNTYKWQWNEAAMGANFNPLQSDSLKTTDSLAVQLLPQNRQTQRYALVSKDGCTPIVDTAYFTFNIAQNQPQAKLMPQDSAICPGTAIDLQANISSGTALGYHWKWQNQTATILQSDTGFLVNPLTVTPDFSTQTAQNYTFILMDNCSPYSDTATTTVLPRADLQAIPSKINSRLFFPLVSQRERRTFVRKRRIDFDCRYQHVGTFGTKRQLHATKRYGNHSNKSETKPTSSTYNPSGHTSTRHYGMQWNSDKLYFE